MIYNINYNNINKLLGGISNYWLYPCNYENPKDCMIVNKCNKNDITYHKQESLPSLYQQKNINDKVDESLKGPPVVPAPIIEPPAFAAPAPIIEPPVIAAPAPIIEPPVIAAPAPVVQEIAPAPVVPAPVVPAPIIEPPVIAAPAPVVQEISPPPAVAPAPIIEPPVVK